MPVEKVNLGLELAFITNKYGKFLSYNMPRLNEAYECLSYQYPIKNIIENGDYEVFIDVGAYVGYFSIMASHFCKEVIAYEAQPLFYGFLLNNTRTLSNIECKYNWVSNKGDIPKMAHPFLLANVHSGTEYNVKVVTLDDELLHLKDKKVLIKMDIEGNELKALKGSLEILKCKNIHWFIDVHMGALTGLEMEDLLPFFEGRDVIKTIQTLEVK